jgi:DNA-binding GntR family transcriptional regulator
MVVCFWSCADLFLGRVCGFPHETGSNKVNGFQDRFDAVGFTYTMARQIASGMSMAKTIAKDLSPLNSPPGALRDRVYNLLRKALREGEIRPNQHLGEHSLAKELHVSRTPVREALALLMRDGLLVSTSKGLMLPELSIDDIRQIYEIRKLIEPAGMKETAMHATKQQVAALRNAVKSQAAAQKIGDVRGFLAANAGFRDTALASIPSHRLRRVIELHEDHVQFMRNATMVDPAVRDTVLQGLIGILSAVAARDAERAGALTLKHLSIGERVINQMYAGIARTPILGPLSRNP